MASCGCYYCSPDPCLCRFVNPEAKQPMTSVGAALIEANIKCLEAVKQETVPARVEPTLRTRVGTGEIKISGFGYWLPDYKFQYTGDKIALDDDTYKCTRFTWEPTTLSFYHAQPVPVPFPLASVLEQAVTHDKWTPGKETWGVPPAPKPLTMAGVVEQARELCQEDDDDYDCCEEDDDE
jgi:hypothetical protein